MALLRYERGDAVVLFNGGLTVFERTGGKLLNERWEGLGGTRTFVVGDHAATRTVLRAITAAR